MSQHKWSSIKTSEPASKRPSSTLCQREVCQRAHRRTDLLGLSLLSSSRHVSIPARKKRQLAANAKQGRNGDDPWVSKCLRQLLGTCPQPSAQASEPPAWGPSQQPARPAGNVTQFCWCGWGRTAGASIASAAASRWAWKAGGLPVVCI